MSNAILVPGRPDKDEHYDPGQPVNSQNHWFGWLMRQLIIKDIHAVSVEMPYPFRPRYETWKKEFERFDVDSDTILVGHSCGGGFLVRYLSEHKNLHVGTVLLVAPWINPDNNAISDTADFFDFKIDADFAYRTKGTIVFVSSDDDPSVRMTVDILKRKTTGIDIRRYDDKGHFTREALGTTEFPELLEALTA